MRILFRYWRKRLRVNFRARDIREGRNGKTNAISINDLGAMDSETSGHVPAIYVAKYNRFVDNILGKINNILRANYEPVTVKLTSSSSNTKTNKNKNKTKRKGTKNGTKKSVSRPINVSAVTERGDNENNVEVWFTQSFFFWQLK